LPAKTARDHVIEAMFTSSQFRGYLFEPQTQYWKKKLKPKPGVPVVSSSFSQSSNALINLFNDDRCTEELLSILRSMRGFNTAFKSNGGGIGNNELEERNFTVDFLTPKSLETQRKTITSRIYVNLILVMLARRIEDIRLSFLELIGEFEAQPFLKRFFASHFCKSDGVSICLIALFESEDGDLAELAETLFELFKRIAAHLSLKNVMKINKIF
jgi:hypothetical protein